MKRSRGRGRRQQNPVNRSYDSNGPEVRVRGTAAQALLDRGFGKPKVEIQNTNADFNEAIEQVRSRLLGHPLGTK